ncbi:O-antigen ligase family protein [Pararhodobacter oceanensis]|uniref:O-antigen ligase-related domain-containing protein n=1 Tax=Pararhodobacter oceanensis TaxID=2172121 RepID=A0A2T8HS60_9RHOB|nr:O-antigen ligase family protein [Pararhodobacter oceanensis]PVH28247.1 hypothetical protein DDE20_14205 [Pararhodobacter oceanensis]
MTFRALYSNFWVTTFMLSLIGVGSSIAVISQISYLLCVAFAAHVFFSFMTGEPKIRLGVSFLLLIAFLLSVLISIRDPTGYRILAFNLICGAFFVSSGAMSKIGVPRIPTEVSVVFFALISVIWLLFASFFANGNYAAAVTLIVALPLLSGLKGLLRIIVFTFLIFLLILMGSRAVILSFLFAIFFVSSIDPQLSGSRRAIGTLFLAVVAVLLIYISISYYNDSFYWDQLFLDFSGKRLESGRVDMWSDTLGDLSVAELVFGTGAGGYYEVSEGHKLSLHSSYVFLIVRSGIVSLIFWITFVSSRFLSLRKAGSYWSMVALVCLMVRDLFETTLVANNLPLAAFFWLYVLSGRLDPEKR